MVLFQSVDEGRADMNFSNGQYDARRQAGQLQQFAVK